jgi:hypothetical protein
MLEKDLRVHTGIIVLLGVCSCISPYSQQLKGLHPGVKLPWATGNIHDEYKTLNKNFTDVSTYCLNVQRAMRDEFDKVRSKNNAIGSAFSALTAAISLANGLYSSFAGPRASGFPTAILSFSAQGTSVPTFFFFGSDKRQSELMDRIAGIAEKTTLVYAARDVAGKATADRNRIKAELETVTVKLAPLASSDTGRKGGNPPEKAVAEAALVDKGELKAKYLQLSADLAAAEHRLQIAIFDLDLQLSRLLEACK